MVYAYATDGQDADSTGIAQQLIGRLTAEVFTVILPATDITVTPDINPGISGRDSYLYCPGS